MATDISLRSASTAVPTAAMAEPPQMAVPAEMSSEVRRLMSSSLASQYPKVNVAKMVTAAKRRPCMPTRNTEARSMPKPKSTTLTCSR